MTLTSCQPGYFHFRFNLIRKKFELKVEVSSPKKTSFETV